jgi:hypothetical protein
MPTTQDEIDEIDRALIAADTKLNIVPVSEAMVRMITDHPGLIAKGGELKALLPGPEGKK